MSLDSRFYAPLAHDTEPMDTAGVFALFRRPSWMRDASCLEHPELSWYLEKGDDIRKVKSICATCLVQQECLEAALERNEHFGVWGGKSENDRRRIRRSRQANEPRPPAHRALLGKGSKEMQKLRDERRLLVGILREQGLSVRAIADGAGINVATVQNDVSALRRILGS